MFKKLAILLILLFSFGKTAYSYEGGTAHVKG